MIANFCSPMQMVLKLLLSKRPIFLHPHCGLPVRESKNYLSTMSEQLQVPLLELARNVVPDLEEPHYKGQAGRIGVVGGSFEYTGAPFFAAISALKVGADLVHVFCQQAAAQVIKSYSPELIVHPLLDAKNAIMQMEPWLDRLHVMVIGPGLGKDITVLNNTAELIRICRQLEKPVIIDADGLTMVTQDISLVSGYVGAVLTPNGVEFARLFGHDRDLIMQKMGKLGRGVTVLEKGPLDKIYDSSILESYDCTLGGSGRRCGGQGDLLAGALATFYFWCREYKQDINPAVVACYAASVLTKNCNAYAYKIKGRSMTCSDMIGQIHNVFNDIFEHKKKPQVTFMDEFRQE